MIEDVAKLFEFYSDKLNCPNNTENAQSKMDISHNLKTVVEIIERFGFNKSFDSFNYVDRQTKKLLLKKNKALVLFSGGKDSVASAIKLKNEGYDTTLYFLKGINKAYPKEIESARECADLLGLPLVVQELNISGVGSFLENPVKNLVIYACGFSYGAKNSIGTYVFGNHREETLDKANFDRDFSDSFELIKAYTEYIEKENCAKIYQPTILDNVLSAIDIVYENDKKLFNVLNGCISPNRFQKKLKAINETKYNVKLFKHECGSCWKCCVRYIYAVDKNYEKNINKEYYKHCLNVLKTKIKTERQRFMGEHSLSNAYRLFIGAEPSEKYYNIVKEK